MNSAKMPSSAGGATQSNAQGSSLPVEIERKYLLRDSPVEALNTPPVFIEQGWLPGSAIRERLRRRREPDGAESYWRTIKLGSALTRIEVEEEIDLAFFSQLWPLTSQARIRKNRHIVAYGSHKWEIDVFISAFINPPLVLAEIELTDENESFSIPDWLAPYIVRDVTGESAYFNSSLARPDE